jgi:hypothetical protein
MIYLNFEYYVLLTSFSRSVFNKELTLVDIMKFTIDDNMKCLVVEYANGSFYGFNLVDENERHDATNIVADVDNDFTIIGWRMSEKKPSWENLLGLFQQITCYVLF